MENKIEFKTLKDFEFSQFVEDDLRDEAIKWVKEKRILPFGHFAEFFNITTEDLK